MDSQIAALLSEVHNAVQEKEAKKLLARRGEPTQQRHSAALPSALDVPSNVLVAFHALAPKATRAALNILDTTPEVEAFVCAGALAFQVGEYVATVRGLVYDEHTGLIETRLTSTVRNSCNCHSFSFGSDRVCKHVLIAGLCAVCGLAQVKILDAATFAARLRAKRDSDKGRKA